jgi:voltage-gated potassium channel
MNKVKKMKGHFIVAGGGRVGSHAAEALKNYTDKIVIIDNNDERVNKLRKKGFTVVKGDLLDEHFLKEINIENAKYLIACLGNDSDNILLVLTVRELNPGIKISARANVESTVQKLKHAGASHVVVPASLGGDELAKAAVRSG